MKNMGSVLKEGFSYQWKYPKPGWAALSSNEVPITGGNQGELENHAQEETKGVRKKGMLNGDQLIHREGKSLRYENPQQVRYRGKQVRKVNI